MGEHSRAWKKDNNTIYLATNETGLLVILKSTDRGITWGQIYEHSDLYTYQVRALGGVPSTDILFLIGYSQTNGEVAIFRSEDGGANFTKVFAMTSTGCEYMPFLYTTSGRIITISKSANTIYVLTSDDVGKSFRMRFTYGFYGSNLGIFSLVEGDNGRIFGTTMDAGGSYVRLLYSVDNGNNWSVGNLPAYALNYPGPFAGNSLRLANGTIVVLGANINSSQATQINYTTDNGNSWSGRSLSSFQVYRAIAVQNSIVFQNYTDKKIYILSDVASGTPTSVGTASFEINDFIGFE